VNLDDALKLTREGAEKEKNSQPRGCTTAEQAEADLNIAASEKKIYKIERALQRSSTEASGRKKDYNQCYRSGLSFRISADLLQDFFFEIPLPGSTNAHEIRCNKKKDKIDVNLESRGAQAISWREKKRRE
jgi:hypothetical protein